MSTNEAPALVRPLSVELRRIADEIERRERLEDSSLNSLNLSQFPTLESRENDLEELVSVPQALRNSGYEEQLVCVIDGDGFVFSKDLIRDGRDGGLTAARLLIAAIRADNPNLITPRILIQVFLNRKGLNWVLQLKDYPLDHFIAGFNCAGDGCFMIDVGSGKEVADSRIRGCISQGLQDVRTRKVYFGGCHDSGYVSFLDNEITYARTHKLVLLVGPPIVDGLQRLGLPTFNIDGLFEPVALKTPARSYTSLMPTPLSPQKPVPLPVLDIPVNTDAVAPDPKLYINPSISIFRHRPKPCRNHYLFKECKSKDCTYSHDYEMGEVDVQRFRDEMPECKTDSTKGQCTKHDCYFRHHNK